MLNMMKNKFNRTFNFFIKVTVGIVILHYIFILFLTEYISVFSIIIFLLSILLIFPPIQRLILKLPLLNRKSIRIMVFFFLIILSNIILETGNHPVCIKENYAFTNCVIIDGHKKSTLIHDGIVLVNNQGIIVDVGSSSTVSIPQHYKIIDLQKKYLLPGLINAHAHLALTGSSREEPLDLPFIIPSQEMILWVSRITADFIKTYPGKRIATRIMEKNITAALKAGVTTIRGLGDPYFYDVALRKRIEQDKFIGPRLLVSGLMLCTTGGHAEIFGNVFNGPHEGRKAVRINSSNEVDVIKISNTGGIGDSKRIGDTDQLHMTIEEISAVCDEAHRRGLMVASHAECKRGVKEALLGGVDSIEHGSDFDDDIIRLFKNNPKSLRGYTTFHPTLLITAKKFYKVEEIKNIEMLYAMYVNWSRVSEGIIKGFKKAINNDVKVAIGTDAGAGPLHSETWKELKLFIDYGKISNQHAIHIGTLATAESIGIENITGSIDRGKSADFMIVDKNPLEDISALLKPEMVILRGMLIKNR
jgi:imidazolonepropionase-like amidohydrolase